MTIDEASGSLWEKYHQESWFTAIGVDAPHHTKIFFYVKKKKPAPKITEWEGHPVEIIASDMRP